MKPITIIPLLLVLMLCGAATIDKEPKEILLWPNGAPGSEGKVGPDSVRITDQGDIVLSNIHKPSITPYLPDSKIATGAAIIVIPGGGHSSVWIGHEGYNPAHWFKAHGIAAFVLKYRLAREKNSTYTVDRDELADVQQAIKLVKSKAKEWGIDTARVGVLGFSAGGELAGLAAMRYTSSADKPAFQGLIYPGNINRLKVSKNSPPAFIAAGYQDRDDIAVGAAQLYLKYKQAKIPAELHIYGKVGHGFGVRPTDKGDYAQWPDEFAWWLADMGFLKAKVMK